MRRSLAVACFVLLAAVAVRPPALSMPFRDLAAVARGFAISADPEPWYPDYPRFLEAVRAHTRPGDSIALIAPTDDWDAGYSYAYYRASYFLAGREVLPVITNENRLVAQNISRARYVAVWHRNVSGNMSRRVVFAQHQGVLLER